MTSIIYKHSVWLPLFARLVREPPIFKSFYALTPPFPNFILRHGTHSKSRISMFGLESGSNQSYRNQQPRKTQVTPLP